MVRAVDLRIENIFRRKYFDIAFNKMVKRKGAGSDNIQGSDLPRYWKENELRIKEALLSGKYVPNPAIKRYINKPGKDEKRGIEIPCIIDRVIQLSISRLLSDYYDKFMSDRSYGFRKRKNQFGAIMRCNKIISKGFTIALKLDIKSFFDTVDHDLMMSILRRDIKDSAMLKIIEAYLKTRVISGYHTFRKYVGLCQGSPLSPLLANIYLHELDIFLEGRVNCTHQNGHLYF